MKLLIGVCNHDFRRGVRIGKLHLAYAGVGKAFCGRRTNVEEGLYMTYPRITKLRSEICEVCYGIRYPMGK